MGTPKLSHGVGPVVIGGHDIEHAPVDSATFMDRPDQGGQILERLRGLPSVLAKFIRQYRGRMLRIAGVIAVGGTVVSGTTSWMDGKNIAQQEHLAAIDEASEFNGYTDLNHWLRDNTDVRQYQPAIERFLSGQTGVSTTTGDPIDTKNASFLLLVGKYEKAKLFFERQQDL